MRVTGAAAVTMSMVVVREHRAMHVMGVLGSDMHLACTGVFARLGMGRDAFHRDGRERLNRKAQCKQDNDEEFAPIRHGSGV